MRKLYKLMILAFVMGLSVQSLDAAKYRVNNMPNTNADFDDLQEALNSIESGDTLYVEGSSIPYSAADGITKKVILLGPGYLLGVNKITPLNQLEAVINNISITSTASSTYISGIVIGGSFFIGASDVIINKCYVIPDLILYNDINFGFATNAVITRSIFERSITIRANNVTIKNNLIGGLLGANGSGSGIAVIANNTFYTSSTQGHSGLENKTFTDNIFLNTTTSTILRTFVNSTVSNGNIFATPWSAGSETNPPAEDPNNTYGVDFAGAFIDFDCPASFCDGSFQPNPDFEHPDFDISEKGAFAGATPYTLSGVSGPIIIEADIPDFATKEEGLPVQIKIKSFN